VIAEFDLIIRQAQLRGRPGSLVDIGIHNGKIAQISEVIDSGAKQKIDAAGNLVTESFVNPHLHLCKVYTLQMMDEAALKDYHAPGMGKAMSAIELAARVKENYAESWIIENVHKAIKEAVRYGCTHIRAFADVDSKARLEASKL
jgi:cytosine deaminase